MINPTRPPTVKVVSHRKQSQSKFRRQPAQSISLNDVLRNGGCLPDVFQGGQLVEKEAVLKEVKAVSRGKPKRCVQNIASYSHQRNTEQAVSSAVAPKADREELSFRAPSDITPAHEKHSNHLRNLSTMEYLFIVTEMNEALPLQPYNPEEFTQHNEHSADAELHSEPKRLLGMSDICDADRGKLLNEIQNELVTWRGSQNEGCGGGGLW